MLINDFTVLKSYKILKALYEHVAVQSLFFSHVEQVLLLIAEQSFVVHEEGNYGNRGDHLFLKETE